MNPLLRPLLPVVVGLLVVGAFCFTLERCFPARPGYRLLRPFWRTDLTYAVLTPLVVRVARRIVIGLILLPVALMAGQGMHVEALLGGFGPLAQQPRWLQAAELLVAADFIAYWEHRLFHGRALWRIHAVHHSSEQLDWLAAFRVHPLNDIGSGVCRSLPLLALGFAPLVLAGVLPLLTIHAIFLHANVPWSFGPLRYVISSPAFHRWHHTSQDEGRDRNFAGLFPVWDLLFGTFHLPRQQPERFGVDEAVPDQYLAQLLWPFRGAAVRNFPLPKTANLPH